MKKIFFLFVLLAFFSCEKTIELEEKFVKSKIVVNCLFNENKSWAVDVSRSLSILDNANLDRINNAKVELFDENDNFIEELFFSSNGYVSSSGNKPVAGNKYKIKVSAPDYKEVNSSDYCPVSVPILSGDTSSEEGQYGGITKNVKLKFKDPSGEKNFYAIQVEAFTPRYYWDNSKMDYDTIYEQELVYLNSSNPVVNNAGENLYTNALTFKDALFNGQEKTINFSFNQYFSQDTNNLSFKVRLLSLTESTYKYLVSFAAYQDIAGNPFAEPVIVYTNIENGFGIFGGQTSSEIKF